jgi:hypothetical protein
MKRILALLIALFPAISSAQSFRVGAGIAITPKSAAPTAASTRGTLWVNSGDSNKLYYRVPGGSSAAVGGGTGTVTSVVAGAGLSGGTITTTGTVSVTAASTSNLGSGFQPVKYSKDAFGFVHLDGVLNAVGGGTVIFNLPAGCRPAATVLAIFAGSVSGTFTAGRIGIGTGGDVTVVSGGGDFVSLAGITFLATQ